MDGNKHGRALVGLLAGFDDQLESCSSSYPREKKVDSYILQTMYFNYGGDNIALVLVKGEMMSKKHDPVAYYNLSLVNLGKEGIDPKTIDDFVRQHIEGLPSMPVLLTSQYVIAEGNLAKNIYWQLANNIPATVRDFATELGVYSGPNTLYQHPSARRLFPDQLTRTKLGR